MLLAACLAVTSGCGSDAAERTFVAKPLACDLDQSSLQAKDTIERVGGLVADDYVVRFSESTRAGVVALVSGDTRIAFDQLTHRYTGVAIVAQIDKSDTSDARVTGFQQIRDLVEAACPDGETATSP